jgi:tetratricopeptide (TPR) repeat protein
MIRGPRIQDPGSASFSGARALVRDGLITTLALLQVVFGLPMLLAPSEAQAQMPEPKLWIAPLKASGAAGLGLLSEKLDEAVRQQLVRSVILDLSDQHKATSVTAGEADPRVEQAETLRVGGQDAYKAKDWAGAQKNLQAALELYEQGLASINKLEAIAQTLGYLGATAVEQGFGADAKDYFKRVVAMMPEGTPLEEYGPKATKLYTKVQKKLLKKKRGALKIDSVPPGATIRIDGEERGVAPLTVTKLVRGEHYIQASHGEAGLAAVRTRVKGGKTRSVTLTLETELGPGGPKTADAELVAELRDLAAKGSITGAFRDKAEAIAAQTRAQYVVVGDIVAQGNNFVLTAYIYGVEEKQTAAFDLFKFRADLASVFVQASNFSKAIEKAVETFPFDKVVVGQLVAAALVIAPAPAPAPEPVPAPIPVAPTPAPEPVAVAPAPAPFLTDPPPPVEDPKDDDDGSLWWVWTLVGVAAAGGAIAGGYVLSQSQDSGSGSTFDAEVRW